MSSSSKKRIAVIGLGNPLRGDDGVGIAMLDRLKKIFLNNKTDFLDFGTASHGLLAYLGEYEKVLLIDAISAGLEPGILKIFRLDQAAYQVQEKKISSHELTLGDLLSLCQSLQISSEIFIAGIQVKETAWDTGLSDDVSALFEKNVEEISGFLSGWGLNR